MVVVTSRSPGVVLLLLAAALLLACTATGVAEAATGDGSSTICDKAKCGRGTCSEVPGPIPLPSADYKCTCDPGWSQPKMLNLTVLDWVPCMIPDCSVSSACLNHTLLTPPRGIPVTDPCVVIDCGQGGYCEKGDAFSYQCRCNPGFQNMLNDTSMPCIGGSCTFGPDCAKLGLVNTPAAPAPAPAGNDLY